MSEATSPARTFVTGGGPRLGFALAMEEVRRLLPAGDLPPRHRRVTLPGLFGGDTSPGASRFAEVAGGGDPTFLELGPGVRVRALSEDALAPIPAILATTARRWGWKGLLREEGGVRILLDVAWIASLAAPRTSAPVAEALP